MYLPTVHRALPALVLAVGCLAGCAVGPTPEVTIGANHGSHTFGDAMAPMSATPWPSDALAVASGGEPPDWPNLTRTRWDAEGAFTHSQQPSPVGTVSSVVTRGPVRPNEGAEYPGFNASLRNADVSFTITAQHFAIAYLGNQNVDAMVWVDGRPVAAQPIFGSGPAASATANWIAITLPQRKTVTVRFAGPLAFTGVDTPGGETAVIAATKPAVTLGVLSDSYYELCPDTGCMSRNAAPTLSTLTGFRVWNMSEAGTGYLNPGHLALPGFDPSPFGSKQRLGAAEQAPIDALLIGGSINDAIVPRSNFRETVDRLLDALETARPDLPVVLLGVEPLPGEYQSKLWRLRGRDLTAVLRSMVGRHKNVVGFIDPFTKPWLTGTGSIVDPKGDGNADRYIGADGIHPSAAGTRYYQERVVAGLRKIPFPKPAAER